MLSSALAAALALSAFHLSLVATSAPLSHEERETVDRAVDLLAAKGFDREVFMLRNAATFRSTDHWLNRIAVSENAFAATNFPFQIVTIYPDFYTKAADDTERAMILLHEAQHLMAGGEAAAYGYVWQNRSRLGWTQLTHGTTETYVTIAEQTRENSPTLFNCPSNLWNDCTETLRARR
jgi:hypothetical protein